MVSERSEIASGQIIVDSACNFATSVCVLGLATQVDSMMNHASSVWDDHCTVSLVFKPYSVAVSRFHSCLGEVGPSQ